MYAVVVRGAQPRRRGRAGTSRITRRQMREASPGFFAQLDWAVRVPILAGAGAALILRGVTVLGALVSGGGRNQRGVPRQPVRVGEGTRVAVDE
jgi:hypothetical protein